MRYPGSDEERRSVLRALPVSELGSERRRRLERLVHLGGGIESNLVSKDSQVEGERKDGM